MWEIIESINCHCCKVKERENRERTNSTSLTFVLLCEKEREAKVTKTTCTMTWFANKIAPVVFIAEVEDPSAQGFLLDCLPQTVS